MYRSPLIEASSPEWSFKEARKTSEKEAAGLQSQKFTKTSEPPLQHKRFVPTTTDSHKRSPTNNVQRTKSAIKKNPDDLNSEEPDRITKNEAEEVHVKFTYAVPTTLALQSQRWRYKINLDSTWKQRWLIDVDSTFVKPR